ncbi:hypothetical protein K5G30_002377 [Enterococcus faecalis]|nr:hypothetical protein [Enterococcus faecalis]
MSFKTGAQKFLSDAKAYTDKVAKKLTDSLNEHKEDTNNPHSVTAEQAGTYAKEHLDETFSTKEEVTQTANEIKAQIAKIPVLDWRKVNVIATQAFFVVADESGKAKKILYWNDMRDPFKETPTSCNLYQQTYNLTENKWKLNILRWANYESYQINGRGNMYVFNIEADINAQDIDICSFQVDWIDETYGSTFAGIPKIIQATT